MEDKILKDIENPGFLKIRETMELLGCQEIRTGVYRSPNFNYDFDLSATDPSCILKRLAQIFLEKGFESCQREFREVLGF